MGARESSTMVAFRSNVRPAATTNVDILSESTKFAVKYPAEMRTKIRCNQNVLCAYPRARIPDREVSVKNGVKKIYEDIRRYTEILGPASN